MLRVLISFLIFVSIAWSPGFATEKPSMVADGIAAILQTDAKQIDYARAKLRFDAMIDPTIDIEKTSATLDQMAATVRKMMRVVPIADRGKSVEKLQALQALIYHPGDWNSHKPYAYDLEDPFGQKPASQLLTHYLQTRRGNCVSMPILFLVLGEKLGLDLTLSTAPLHVLLKYTDDQNGQTYNLEATSGAGFTRDVWYQKKAPMSQKSLDNGLYLESLTRKETLAVMAMSVVDHLIRTERYEEAIAASSIILKAYPKFAYAMVKRGTAYGHLLRTRFLEKYPNRQDIPRALHREVHHLYLQNQSAFAEAEALGWQETKLQ